MANIITRNLKWLATKAQSHFYRRDPELWVFGEWFGNRCCDNSLYLANYIAENHPQLKLVWIARKEADTSLLAPSVRRVEMDTYEALEVLHHAGVAVMNQGMNDFTSEIDYHCDGAVTVNLWHGIPWKQIGIDVLQAGGTFRKYYGRYLMYLQRADLYLATSDSFGKIMHEKYYAGKNGVLLAGYPRNALFYDPKQVAACRNKALMLLRGGYNVSADVKIITYMPTFRDNTQEVFSFNQLEQNPRLNEILENHNAVIVQRAHFVSNQRGNNAGDVGHPRITCLEGITSQELLAATDLLITDYSSCFFDYLLLDRPIIHYLYDYEYYAKQDRGLYYPKESVVCGDDVQDVETLLDSLEQNLSNPGRHVALRDERRRQHMQYESFDSCRTIYEEICKKLK